MYKTLRFVSILFCDKEKEQGQLFKSSSQVFMGMLFSDRIPFCLFSQYLLCKGEQPFFPVSVTDYYSKYNVENHR